MSTKVFVTTREVRYIVNDKLCTMSEDTIFFVMLKGKTLHEEFHVCICDSVKGAIHKGWFTNGACEELV